MVDVTEVRPRIVLLLRALVAALAAGGLLAMRRRLRREAAGHGESEARYLSVLEHMEDAFFRTDDVGDLVLTSPSFARLFGFESAEQVHRLDPVRDLGVDAGDMEAFLQAIHSAGSVRDHHLTLRRRDGARLELSANGHFYRDPKGRVLGVEGVLRDVTEQLRTVRALAEAEERLDLVIRSAGVGTWDWDIRTDTAHWDDRLIELYGMEPGVHNGPFERFYTTIHPDDRSILRAAVDRALTTDAPYEAEFRVVRPDGEVGWVSERGKVYRDDRGTPVRMSGLTWDATERRLAEQALAERTLHEQEEKIRMAYVDVLDAVTGGKLILLTEEALKQELGSPLDEAVAIGSTDQVPEARGRVIAAAEHRYPGQVPDKRLLSAVCEALENALKHAGGGTYQVFSRDGLVQVAVTDEGPGIDFKTLPRATLVPGFSTTSTLGVGFTMMLQLSDRVLLSTRPGRTQVVLEVAVDGGVRSDTQTVEGALSD
jgi:PAS domain S-box-containing protein